MKIIGVIAGLVLGGVLGFITSAICGTEVSKFLGVTGYEQVAYFEFLVLMPIYLVSGALTGGATAFALIPGKKEQEESAAT